MKWACHQHLSTEDLKWQQRTCERKQKLSTCANEKLLIGNQILKIDDATEGTEFPAGVAEFSV
jgi:hypothetical protein